MVKVMHVIVCGAKCVGKTCILQQLALLQDITNQPYIPTIDDTYSVQMENLDKPKEVIVFHDTAGVSYESPELRRPYIQAADAFVFVYDVSNMQTLHTIESVKRLLERQLAKDKKEIPIIVLGNVNSRRQRIVEMEFALAWSQKEKVKLYEVNAADRKTLVEPVVYLGTRFFHPPKESRFSLKSKKADKPAGAAILMDI